LLLAPQGVLWARLRSDAFQMLSEAATNRMVQENAYELLHWITSEFQRQAHANRKAEDYLVGDQALFERLWQAATASQLSPVAVYRLKELPGLVQKWNIACELPVWWQPTLAELGIPSVPGSASEGAPPDGPKEDPK
jgi:hypothetical protein